jgi:hypothetical protein
MEKKTQPCSLCGELMYEDGDGWDCGEPGSPAGFYSSHWACVYENPEGRFMVVSSRGYSSRYTTRKRANQMAERMKGYNPESKFEVVEVSE